MPENFGARLRQQREARQIDLIAIAAQTKIKQSLLEGLERDDVSQWPAGIFRRAYIRTYAHSIGLDPDAVLREFLEVHPEPVADFASTASALEDASPKSPPTRLRTIVDSALDTLVRLTNKPRTAEDSAPKATPAARPEGTVTAPAAAAPRASTPALWAPSQAPKPVIPTTAPEVTSALAMTLDLPEIVADAGLALNAEAPVVEAVSEVARTKEAQVEEVVATPELTQPDEELLIAEKPAPRQTEPPFDRRLEAVAQLCTEFGRVVDRHDIQRLLNESARLLNAAGLIVWLWDEISEELRPTLVQGYSDKVLAHLPAVKRDDDNATSAAFRSENSSEVAATPHTSAAVVVPLLIPEGCAGVLAIELQQGVQPGPTMRAIAALLAAALTQLAHRSQGAPRRTQTEQPAPAVAARFTPALPQPVRVRR